jgi:hypothetical protein
MYGYKVVIDKSRTPHHITLASLEHPEVSLLGIYQLQKNRLLLAYRKQERPTSFERIVDENWTPRSDVSHILNLSRGFGLGRGYGEDSGLPPFDPD